MKYPVASNVTESHRRSVDWTELTFTTCVEPEVYRETNSKGLSEEVYEYNIILKWKKKLLLWLIQRKIIIGTMLDSFAGRLVVNETVETKRSLGNEVFIYLSWDLRKRYISVST